MLPEQRFTWLKSGSSAPIIAFGLLSLSATLPMTSGFMLVLADLIFWPLDDAQSLAATETRVFAAIAGGLMVGFGELLWLVSNRLYLHEPDLVRRLILPSFLGWFVVDGLGSVLAGAPLNALLNTLFLPAFLVPLLWSEKHQTLLLGPAFSRGEHVMSPCACHRAGRTRSPGRFC